ncbi:MAG: alpha/beta fold hydrolase [Candidatus Binatia bacterium]
MPQLTRDGFRIWYEDHGSGPAILLSSGYGATARIWDPQIRALAECWRLIVWDLRGHGQSDAPQDPAAYTVAISRKRSTARSRSSSAHCRAEPEGAIDFPVDLFASIYSLDTPARKLIMIFKITGVGNRMILCHCAAVSDKTIERLIGEGANTVADVTRRCGAGRCEPCRDAINDMLVASRALPHDRVEEPRRPSLRAA